MLTRSFFLHSVNQDEKYDHSQNARHHANQSNVVHASPSELKLPNLNTPTAKDFQAVIRGTPIALLNWFAAILSLRAGWLHS